MCVRWVHANKVTTSSKIPENLTRRAVGSTLCTSCYGQNDFRNTYEELLAFHRNNWLHKICLRKHGDLCARTKSCDVMCCLCFLEPAWQTSNPPTSAVTASIKSIQHSVCKLRKSRRSWASNDIHTTQALSDTLISWIFESLQVPFALQAKHASTRQWMTDASRACRSRKLTRHQQRCSSPLWWQVAPCGRLWK